MPTTDLQNAEVIFDSVIATLKTALPYVEDESFSWDDVIGLLVIKLKNTDSLNKDRKASHATQIQLTSEKEATDGFRKTEDFFPTLTLNASFKSWRLSVPARVNSLNIKQLSGNPFEVTDNWKPDTIQIRRRLLNDDGQGNGNPTLHICYGNDLMPLRELLGVDDYLVIVKRKSEPLYDVFGVKGDIDLGAGKNMYMSSAASGDSTTFEFSSITANYDFVDRRQEGTNIILYGIPGSGKSWTIEQEYCKDETKMERLVFHPDYMYSDFIGQILPVIRDDKVRYEFSPGPFTKLLKRAYQDPKSMYYLIIEEINRGNAPAIFGEIFQLLDRIHEAGKKFPIGTSEYGITNANIAKEVYGDPDHKVRIPSNLSIIGTMNTSDQNVFTLDTAFQRRWIMRMIPNSFENHSYANKYILDTIVSWKAFCEAINGEILRRNNVTSSEDKRLGAYFITSLDLDWIDEDELHEKLMKSEDPKVAAAPTASREWIDAHHKNSHFAEKVLKYLWDDAFKFSHAETFNTKLYSSLEAIIAAFMEGRGNKRLRVFNENLRKAILESAKVDPASEDFGDESTQSDENTEN